MKRAKHNLSNYKLASMKMGYLTPVGVTEVVRGDSISQSTSALVRVAPMLAPVMHPVHAKIHHWFVPHRLTWKDWETFITGGPDGTSTPVFPTITTTVGQSSLLDYMGLPTTAGNKTFSALPVRAYNLIYNEFYRDQDLCPVESVSTDSGPDISTNTMMLRAAWNKDYFTVARPEPQKGPEIIIPVRGDSEIHGNNTRFKLVPGALGATPRDVVFNDTDTSLQYGGAALGTEDYAYNAPNTGMEVGDQHIDLLDVRLAGAMQRFQEARSRFGSRYTEFLNYYGIKSSDARLQRPEYLGGGRQTIQFSEILATTNNEDTTLGELGGHGIGAMKSARYKKFFEEDGYIISVMITQPITMYTQGIPRTWNRRLKEDFFQKELQHIGQQAILNKELYSEHSDPDGTFGFVDRYDEYRFQENTVAGEFRSSLDYWHMARIFGAEPALNASFIQSNPTNRIYASQTTDELYVMIRHNIIARRLVAKHGSSFLL